MKKITKEIVVSMIVFIFFATCSFLILNFNKTVTAMAVLKIGQVNGEKIETLQSLFWRLHNSGTMKYSDPESLIVYKNVITQPIDDSTGVIKLSSNDPVTALKKLDVIVNAIQKSHDDMFHQMVDEIEASYAIRMANTKKNISNAPDNINQFNTISPVRARKTVIISPPEIQQLSDSFVYYKSIIVGFFGILIYEIFVRFIKKKV